MLCEWNPLRDTERGELTPDGDCTRQAAVLVGASTAKFRLCVPCSHRPYFRMFKNRVPLVQVEVETVAL